MGIKNEGIKLLKMPITSKYHNIFRGIRSSAGHATGIKHKNAMVMRKAPTCVRQKLLEPFINRINQVDHMSDNNMKTNFCMRFGGPLTVYIIYECVQMYRIKECLSLII